MSWDFFLVGMMIGFVGIMMTHVVTLEIQHNRELQDMLDAEHERLARIWYTYILKVGDTWHLEQGYISHHTACNKGLTAGLMTESRRCRDRTEAYELITCSECQNIIMLGVMADD